MYTWSTWMLSMPSSADSRPERVIGDFFTSFNPTSVGQEIGTRERPLPRLRPLMGHGDG